MGRRQRAAARATETRRGKPRKGLVYRRQARPVENMSGGVNVVSTTTSDAPPAKKGKRLSSGPPALNLTVKA